MFFVLPRIYFVPNFLPPNREIAVMNDKLFSGSVPMLSNTIARAVSMNSSATLLRVAVIAFAFGALSANAAEPKPGEGKHYGKSFSKVVTEVEIGALLDHPDDYVDKRVQVKGIVTDVCTRRGCWIKLGSEDGKTVRFKVTDGEIVFPVEVKGKRAVAQGVFTKNVVSVAELKEQGEKHAKMEGKSFDPASVTEPAVFYQLTGEGAQIR